MNPDTTAPDPGASYDPKGPVPTADPISPPSARFELEVISGGVFRVRRPGFAEPIFLTVGSGYALRPADLLMVQGGGLCVVNLVVNGEPPYAVAQVQSIPFKPARPLWEPPEDPNPQLVEYRFVTFQSPPVVEVRHHTIDGELIYEVFVGDGMIQIWG